MSEINENHPERRGTPYQFIDKEGYNRCMKYVGRLEAIISQIEELDSIGYNDITEEEYDENITQASSLLFHAKMILESSSKRYLEGL